MHPDAGIPSDADQNSPRLPAAASASGAPAAERGLPPVEPPSGRFILQLFLVPGLIIAAVVGMFLGWRWFFGGPASAAYFLEKLDDDNAEVRWRAAEDLARVLPRQDHLAQDVGLGLGIAERLRRALDDNDTTERAHAERVRRSKAEVRVPKALEGERAHVIFLASCLGYFQVPVGAPLLRELALQEEGADEEAVFRRRANAVLALMNLGGSLRKFDALEGPKKTELMARLNEEKSDGERGRWAGEALAYLEDRAAGRASDRLGVARALVECAAAKAPFLRKQVAAALTFWDGPGVEAALARLAGDDGRGEEPVRRGDPQAEYRRANKEEVRRLNEKQIRYNAVLTLARRGSDRARDHFALIGEMLDEDRQREVWRTGEAGEQGAHEAGARQVVPAALQALEQLRRKNPGVDLAPLRPAIDRLAHSDNQAVRMQAKELQKKLD